MVALVKWRWLRVVALAWLAVVASGGFGEHGGGCE